MTTHVKKDNYNLSKQRNINNNNGKINAAHKNVKEQYTLLATLLFYMDCVILPGLSTYLTVSRVAAAYSLLNLLAVVTLESISLLAGLLMFGIA